MKGDWFQIVEHVNLNLVSSMPFKFNSVPLHVGATFDEWNGSDLESFLIEITAKVLRKRDDREGESGHLVDKILDQAGSKGTGKWTVQLAADSGVAAGEGHAHSTPLPSTRSFGQSVHSSVHASVHWSIHWSIHWFTPLHSTRSCCIRRST